MSPTARDLVARDVSKRFGGAQALDGISLEVRPDEWVALVGESGSGKTTLLRTFNRMVEPDSGEVLVGGQRVGSLDPVELRRSIGYVQQDGGLLPHWTVARNAALVPWLNGSASAAEDAERALDLVGVAPSTFGARWPRELSGGQRQRVALARALAGEPGVLLLDEPLGALDAITRIEMQEALGELRDKLTSTVLLVTHDLREAFHLTDRAAVMRAGRLEQIGTPEELRATPRSPYVGELLAKAGVA